MGLEIYKTGQGKIARGVAYVLGVGLVVFGGYRLFATINRPGEAWVDDVPILGQLSIDNTIAIVVTLLGLLGLHLVLNRAGAVDMLIDTEQELKKVSWPTPKEVQNATIVVVLVTFALAMILFGFDLLLQWVFRLVF